VVRKEPLTQEGLVELLHQVKEMVMITSNDRSTDAEDVGVLFHAIISYAEANSERLDRSLVAVG